MSPLVPGQGFERPLPLNVQASLQSLISIVQRMNMASQKTASIWRWGLIGAEITVAGYLAASILAAPKTRLSVGSAGRE